MYGLNDTTNIPAPKISPQDNYGANIPDTSSLLTRLSTLRNQASAPPIMLAQNLGDKFASGAARGMQFIYQDVPNAAMNLLNRAKTMIPSAQPTPTRPAGYGMTPAQMREEELKVVPQKSDMNSILNTIDRGY